MKKGIAILILIFFSIDSYGQKNKLIIPDTVKFQVGHSNYWRNGEYTFFNKSIITINNIDSLPKKGTELTEDNFEYLLDLFDNDLAWEANLILYAVFNKDARAIFVSNLTKDVWYRAFKEKEFKYWQSLFDEKNWGDFVDD